MPTFIDESGDTGLITDGGRPFFRMAAVWVVNHQQAQDIRDAIRQVRLTLKLGGRREFKFAETHDEPDLRQEFFEAALESDFRFAFSSFDKMLERNETFGSTEQQWSCATDLAVALRESYQWAE